MAHREYARFLEILKKWPVDKSRGNHCFGNYLRQSSDSWFTSDGKAVGNTNETSRRLDSLEKLASNFYGTKYPTASIKSVTGMNLEECGKVLLEEYEQVDKEEKEGNLDDLKKKEATVDQTHS